MQDQTQSESMAAASGSTHAGELVVLVHGLGPGRWPMWPLARRLARAGYNTLNWYYPCLRHTIEAHGRRLYELLESLNAEEAHERLHLATYSMGSVVSRVALELGRPSKLGRIVMLAPPMRGSHWATWVGPMSRCCVRTIDQLAARPNSFVNSLAELQGLEIGVIAARYDLLVHANSSQLAAACDRIVLPGIHTFLPMQRDTAEQVQHFLAHGKFWRGDRSTPQARANAEAKSS